MYLPFRESHLPEFSCSIFYVMLSLFTKEDQVLTKCFCLQLQSIRAVSAWFKPSKTRDEESILGLCWWHFCDGNEQALEHDLIMSISQGQLDCPSLDPSTPVLNTQTRNSMDVSIQHFPTPNPVHYPKENFIIALHFSKRPGYSRRLWAVKKYFPTWHIKSVWGSHESKDPGW